MRSVSTYGGTVVAKGNWTQKIGGGYSLTVSEVNNGVVSENNSMDVTVAQNGTISFSGNFYDAYKTTLALSASMGQIGGITVNYKFTLNNGNDKHYTLWYGEGTTLWKNITGGADYWITTSTNERQPLARTEMTQSAAEKFWFAFVNKDDDNFKVEGSEELNAGILYAGYVTDASGVVNVGVTVSGSSVTVNATKADGSAVTITEFPSSKITFNITGFTAIKDDTTYTLGSHIACGDGPVHWSYNEFETFLDDDAGGTDSHSMTIKVYQDVCWFHFDVFRIQTEYGYQGKDFASGFLTGYNLGTDYTVAVTSTAGTGTVDFGDKTFTNFTTTVTPNNASVVWHDYDSSAVTVDFEITATQASSSKLWGFANGTKNRPWASQFDWRDIDNANMMSSQLSIYVGEGLFWIEFGDNSGNSMVESAVGLISFTLADGATAHPRMKIILKDDNEPQITEVSDGLTVKWHPWTW